MGIDYSGGMIVGELGKKLPLPDGYDSLSEWADENDLKVMSLHYDADTDWCYYGFEVPNVQVSEMNEVWLQGILEKAETFERLTGVPAQLIGTQNIW